MDLLDPLSAADANRAIEPAVFQPSVMSTGALLVRQRRQHVSTRRAVKGKVVQREVDVLASVGDDYPRVECVIAGVAVVRR